MTRFGIIVAMCLISVGCVEVTSIPAASQANFSTSPTIEQSVLDDLESDIRSMVKTIHESRIKDRVTSGNQLDKFRLEGRLIDFNDEIRDPYTGEFYDCSEVVVYYRFNVHSSKYLHGNQWEHTRNVDTYSRTDEICTYSESGRNTYRPGRALKRKM